LAKFKSVHHSPRRHPRGKREGLRGGSSKEREKKRKREGRRTKKNEEGDFLLTKAVLS
jgi:hypothetical protein